jgi:hypothetical protein
MDKRHTNLQPISHEHREILAYCLHLKKGIKTQINLLQLIYYAQWFWQEYLEKHLEQEEEVLAGLLIEHKLWRKLWLEQHEEIRSYFRNKDLSRKDLEDLERKIRANIRFEERELFPFIQKHLTPKTMESISWNKNQEMHCHWIDRFWL